MSSGRGEPDPPFPGRNRNWQKGHHGVSWKAEGAPVPMRELTCPCTRPAGCAVSSGVGAGEENRSLWVSWSSTLMRMSWEKALGGRRDGWTFFAESSERHAARALSATALSPPRGRTLQPGIGMLQQPQRRLAGQIQSDCRGAAEKRVSWSFLLKEGNDFKAPFPNRTFFFLIIKEHITLIIGKLTIKKIFFTVACK